MLTPQDIQEKEFDKAVFGGYDMGAVDQFLEEVEADYASLYKENASLKSKLKVLVDKVEEYRSTDDAMRMAFLTAQKLGDDMMSETQEKCDAMIREAEQTASAERNSLRHDIAVEQNKLELARNETAKFLEATQSLLTQYSSFISRLNETAREYTKLHRDVRSPDEPPRSPEPEPARQPAKPPQNAPLQSSGAPDKPADNPVTPSDIPDVSEEDINAMVAEILASDEFRKSIADEAAASADADIGDTRRIPDISDAKDKGVWTEEDEAMTPRPKFNFNDLQFGKNYDNSGK